MHDAALRISILCTLLLSPAAIAEPPDRWTPELSMEVGRIGDVRVSPDGERVVYELQEAVMTEERSEFVTHLHLATTDGRERFQLTYGEESSSDPRWSPDGGWIAFVSSRAEKRDLWLIRPDGGEAWRLTEVETGVAGFRWSPAGDRIAFTMTPPPSEEEEKRQQGKDDARVVGEDPDRAHLWLVTLPAKPGERGEIRRLTEGEFHVDAGFAGGFDWSPDGRTVVFAHTPTPLANDWIHADVSTVDVESGEVTPLLTSGAAESSPLYSPDGQWIAYQRSEDPPRWGFSGDVHLVAAGGGESRPLAPTFDRWPGLLGWSADGSVLYLTEQEGTVVRILALPTDGGEPRLLDPGERLYESVSLDPSRSWLGFGAQNFTEPEEAFVTRVDDFAPVRVSDANGDLPVPPLGRTEAIRWQGDDDLEIEGLLTYPVGYQEGRRYPLLLIIHGGPMGVFERTFIGGFGYPVASFAADGFAVLRCNIRGSRGYGRDFRYANYEDWGGADYRDLMAGVDRVIELGVADPERLGVMGWSYGGYMSSWIITHTDRFQAASIGAPPVNLVSFNGTADIPDFVPDFLGAEYWDDLEPYRRHSPLFHVGGVTTPTLIQHGEGDARVPVSQGYELHNALKRQGVEVRMVVYPRQPHGITEPKLRLDMMRRNLEWFRDHLGVGETLTPPAPLSPPTLHPSQGEGGEEKEGVGVWGRAGAPLSLGGRGGWDGRGVGGEGLQLPRSAPQASAEQLPQVP